MKVLVACEFSGAVRSAFRRRGHEAYSCDVRPCEDNSVYHIEDDVLNVLSVGWDLMIAHPPCTYLTRAGARWWHLPERQHLANRAAGFVFALASADIPKIAIENPIGQLNQRWRYPDQTIQPWQYGHPYSKATCLWLKNLPLLKPTKILQQFEPLIPSNTSFRSRHGLSQKGRAMKQDDRNRTFEGIAEAMAVQWG